MIRELDALQAPLLTRYRKKGKVYMEIRDSVDQKEPSHTWKYLGREIITQNKSHPEEDIICYMVEDIKPESKTDDMSQGWEGRPGAAMSAHDEAPEFLK